MSSYVSSLMLELLWDRLVSSLRMGLSGWAFAGPAADPCSPILWPGVQCQASNGIPAQVNCGVLMSPE